MRKILLILFVFFCMSLTISEMVFSQKNSQTFWYGVQLRATTAAGDVLPFWLYANRHATIDPYSPGTSAIFDLHKRLTDDSGFDYGFGVTLMGRYSKNETLTFNQLYGMISYGAFQLKGGRYYDHLGDVFAPLSMGSLALSPNAAPIPKIKLGIFEYTPVPFTNGFLEIKGAIAHGWLGENRRFSNAWVHEKYAYLRFGGDFAFKPYIGLVQETIWAGQIDNGYDAPDSFKDFFRIFFALKGDSTALPSGQSYKLGDHRGIWDIGFHLTLSDIEFTVYRQFIYDDKDGLFFERLRDGLLGISVEFTETTQNFVTALLYEYLNTKWQGGPQCPPLNTSRGGPGGCENYYNNSVYRTGWQYLGRTLGNPLFLPVNSPGINAPARKFGFTNNRIIAHHFGIMGNLSTTLKYKLLTTWSHNYGLYLRVPRFHITPNEFESNPEQWSFLANFSYRPESYNNIVRFNLSLAADIGELYENTFGILFGIQLMGTSSF